MVRIAIVDYGMGNLRSVAHALRRVAPEADVRVCASAQELRAADRVVLPGQGAMPDCMRTLAESGLEEAVRESARTKPLLGVCLGEQMLCDHSAEGPSQGLGVIGGECVHFSGDAFASGAVARLKVPHMGWNRVYPVAHEQGERHRLWDGVADGAWFYFVHSYHVVTRQARDVAAQSTYGAPFTCAIARDNIFATQFHPEKSASAGLRLYSNFVSWNP